MLGWRKLALGLLLISVVPFGAMAGGLGASTFLCQGQGQAFVRYDPDAGIYGDITAQGAGSCRDARLGAHELSWDIVQVGVGAYCYGSPGGNPIDLNWGSVTLRISDSGGSETEYRQQWINFANIQRGTDFTTPIDRRWQGFVVPETYRRAILERVRPPIGAFALHVPPGDWKSGCETTGGIPWTVGPVPIDFRVVFSPLVG